MTQHDDNLGDSTRDRGAPEHRAAFDADERPVDDTRDLGRHGRRDDVVLEDTVAHEKFGGLNVGAAFLGWIVAMGVAILLAGIVGAILAAVGSSVEITQSDAERAAGTIGVSTAIVLLVILALAYYTGGYAAGRMSRFDGVRQGVGVWVLGLVVTIIAIALGAIFGDQYNVLDRVDLPRIPISTEQLGWGAVIAGVAVLLVTLMSAALGGALGRRYHHRVDRAVRG